MLEAWQIKPGDERLVDEHFTPTYNVWDERVCCGPNGDLFHAITSGKADVSDRAQIDRFVPEGIRLESGEVPPPTSSSPPPASSCCSTVASSRPSTAQRSTFPAVRHLPGAMIAGLPNFAIAVGYTNVSWTPRLICPPDWSGKVLNWMDERNYAAVVPGPSPALQPRPLMDMQSGTSRRGGLLPEAGPSAPPANAPEPCGGRGHHPCGPIRPAACAAHAPSRPRTAWPRTPQDLRHVQPRLEEHLHLMGIRYGMFGSRAEQHAALDEAARRRGQQLLRERPQILHETGQAHGRRAMCAGGSR